MRNKLLIISLLLGLLLGIQYHGRCEVIITSKTLYDTNTKPIVGSEVLLMVHLSKPNKEITLSLSKKKIAFSVTGGGRLYSDTVLTNFCGDAINFLYMPMIPAEVTVSMTYISQDNVVSNDSILIESVLLPESFPLAKGIVKIIQENDSPINTLHYDMKMLYSDKNGDERERTAKVWENQSKKRVDFIKPYKKTLTTNKEISNTTESLLSAEIIAIKPDIKVCVIKLFSEDKTAAFPYDIRYFDIRNKRVIFSQEIGKRMKNLFSLYEYEFLNFSQYHGSNFSHSRIFNSYMGLFIKSARYKTSITNLIVNEDIPSTIFK